MPNIIGAKVKYKEKWVRDTKRGEHLFGEQDVMLEVVRMELDNPIIQYEYAHPRTPIVGFDGETQWFGSSLVQLPIAQEDWKVAILRTLPGFSDVEYAHEVEISPDGYVWWKPGYNPNMNRVSADG
jgi:hypothetical protein